MQFGKEMVEYWIEKDKAKPNTNPNIFPKCLN